MSCRLDGRRNGAIGWSAGVDEEGVMMYSEV